MRRQCHLIVALAVSLMSCSAALAENWPNWRGPRYNGTSQETNLPTTWSKTENVLWRTPLPGSAGATPVVWGERIFVSSLDGEDLVLICIGTDGKELWKRKVASGNKASRGGEGNSASPSPSTDGKHVCVFMGSGDLACFDLEGKELWRKNLQDEYGKFKIGFGMSSTPLLHDGKLYVQCMYTGASYLVAFDVVTGKELWKVDRPSDAKAECEHSYASPTLYDDGQQKFLITHGADYVVAHSLADGRELWRCGALNPKSKYNSTLRLVASPTTSEGLVVVPSAKNGPVLGLSIGGSGDVTENDSVRVWTKPQGTPDVPSPVVHDGLVYLCRENGVLTCLDAKTGEQVYQESMVRDRYRSSPVYADGKIYCTARGGQISVIKAGREFVRLATNSLGEDTAASPVVSNGRIYIRTFDALYAIGVK